MYTNESILAGPHQNDINDIIKYIRKANIYIIVEGDVKDFLGINIEKNRDGTTTLSQQNLIDHILKDIILDEENTATKQIRDISSKILTRHTKSEEFDRFCYYRKVIEKSNYLKKGSISDISYIVHQCAIIFTCPKREHEDSVKNIISYLRGTRIKGTILDPDKETILEVFCDAYFAGNWDHKETDDTYTAKSRHGYYMKYAGMLVTWKLQLQTEIELSITES